MVYYLITEKDIENAKAEAVRTEKKTYNCLVESQPRRLIGKCKADLVREGALVAQSLGLSECYIWNLSQYSDWCLKDGKRVNITGYYLNQSWYLFNSGSGWAFKMRKDCKASHPINMEDQ